MLPKGYELTTKILDGQAVQVLTPIGSVNSGSSDTPALDLFDDALKISTMQKRLRDSFVGSSLDSSKWESGTVGDATISVTGGNLVLNSGKQANAAAWILSKESFTIPMKASTSLTISQRVANQLVIFELVSVDSNGVPNEMNRAALVWDGTTATQAKYRVQSQGGSVLDSAAVTFPTTVSGSVFEIEPFVDECWFHGSVLDTVAGRANSFRRHLSVPDPNGLYKLRIRVVNSAVQSTATNVTVAYIALQDFTELTTEITAGRGQSAAGQAMSVNVANVSVPVMPASNAAWALSTPLASNINSAATTNLTSVKNAPGTLFHIVATNTSTTAIAYLKLYNKASAPVLASDVPVLTIPLAVSSKNEIDFGTLGHRFSSGIALAITGGAADTDTTAVAASQVKALVSYL